MRNLFDQYKEPENRLTHALACCLAEDRTLLRRFVRWAALARPPAKARLEVLEQRIPSEPTVDLDDDPGHGLPKAGDFHVFLARLEQGDHVSLKTLETLCRKLKCDVGDLFLAER